MTIAKEAKEDEEEDEEFNQERLICRVQMMCLKIKSDEGFTDGLWSSVFDTTHEIELAFQ